ncbi:MAG: sacsin N-terminal ATP-binding-like domain-containing protein [Candidatus Hadarchaeum sp.]|uniref:sacsin N-terminal ATP-binding-like domain-containing protein n=1 Tax=Candidatus Hadarchaeum sp. TaxID=2883567 RepID=UPI003D0AC295
MWRKPPEFFEPVRRKALERWEQLEKDPELAGPWKHLFRQVQSPRHVLSELLQNADDAGARRVTVRIQEELFLFEHDGHDFTEEEFASLCRFGFSNKRTLYTIGFRGIGFKSTFSLGESVELLTPTLAVRFEKQRFTLPIWMEEAPDCDWTRISVHVQDEKRKDDLRKNFSEWIKSPASLLFFRHIEELEIEGRTIRKERVREGPVPGSEVIRLVSGKPFEVLYLASEEEPFPAEALQEIRQERDVEDLNLPPCRVEVVLGLSGPQRLYTVLPTGVEVEMPFSCNGPFLQDPGRSGIKDPSISPTNRWLLTRLGQLAGRSMVAWLANQHLPVEERARAYELLPPRPREGSSLEAQASELLCKAFKEALGSHPVLLTADGKLTPRENCLAPPRRAYRVWEPADLLRVFEAPGFDLLSPLVSEEARRRLDQWELLENLREEDVVGQLRHIRPVPRPRDFEGLQVLWSLVWRHRSQVGYTAWRSSRQEEKPLLELPLVPVGGSRELHPANEVVRLPEKYKHLSDEAWAFLTSLVVVVEPEWIEYLERGELVNSPDPENAYDLLREIGLDRPSETGKLLAQACRHLFFQEAPTLEDHVRMAHLLAAFDAKAPETFRCITRDGQQRSLAQGLLATQDPQVEDLLPHSWQQAHLLHDAYFEGFRLCTRQQWEKWVASKKSGFLPLIPLIEKQFIYYSSEIYKVRDFLKSRGYSGNVDFYAQVRQVEITDYGFPEEVRKFWKKKAREDQAVWAKVFSLLVRSLEWFDWEKYACVRLTEYNYTHSRSVWLYGSQVVSEWIALLSSRPCLFDTNDQPRVAAELYMRTSATEPLLHVEPFVKSELDTKATEPLLRLLGVRDKPGRIDTLLERLRYLARVREPQSLLSEILKWYEALDRILSYQPETIEASRQAFHKEALVLTSRYEWRRAPEVFRSESEELPDVPVIHEAARGLRLWQCLGVRERPDAQSVLAWLGQLSSGQELQEGQSNAVRAALKQYPGAIWRQCGHWLTLDNRWTPTSQIRYRLTMQGLTKWADLHPSIKTATANFQMLSADIMREAPFAEIKDLGEAIEYRIIRRPTATGGTTPPWLKTMSWYLRRVTFSDEETTQRVRSTALRLERSRIVNFKSGELEVMPYLDGAPAGTPTTPTVLWDEENIFIGAKLSKCYEHLANELSKSFDENRVREAFHACIERDDAFIAEYFEEHFTLSDEDFPFDQRDTTENEANEQTHGTGLIPIAQLEEEESSNEEEEESSNEEEEVTRVPRRRHDRIFTVFRSYAGALGFEWNELRERFEHPGGSVIYRIEGRDSIFHWERLKSDGYLGMRYWVAPKTSVTGAFECPAEVWEAIRRYPDSCSMIVERSKQVFELPGRELLKLVESGRLTLFPAAYRLVFDL